MGEPHRDDDRARRGPARGWSQAPLASVAVGDATRRRPHAAGGALELLALADDLFDTRAATFIKRRIGGLEGALSGLLDLLRGLLSLLGVTRLRRRQL